MVKTPVRNLKFTVNPLIQNYIFMLFRAIWIRLKKQPLIIYFKDPIDYVTRNSLIVKMNSFMKKKRYEIYFIDKAYYKARLAYYKARNMEKKIMRRRLFYHQNVKKKILVNLFHLM